MRSFYGEVHCDGTMRAVGGYEGRGEVVKAPKGVSGSS